MSDSMSYAMMVILTLVLGILLQLAWGRLSNHLQKIRLNDRLDEVSIAIGINARKQENYDSANEYLKGKFSPSKFENRATDAIGSAIAVIHFPISIAITVWYFAMVAGRIFGFMYIESLLLWAPMFMQLALSVSILIISVLAKAIFGRYPGEAKGFNKEYIKTIR